MLSQDMAMVWYMVNLSINKMKSLHTYVGINLKDGEWKLKQNQNLYISSF